MATKQKEVIKMDEKQKGSGIAITACVIVAILAVGGVGAYFLTGDELDTPTLASPSDGSQTARSISGKPLPKPQKPAIIPEAPTPQIEEATYP
ncbi:hypothetical protein ES703_04624 [subsurface metagenome]